jgi:hypothetical protein
LKLLKAYKNTMSKKTYIMPTGAKKTWRGWRKVNFARQGGNCTPRKPRTKGWLHLYGSTLSFWWKG